MTQATCLTFSHDMGGRSAHCQKKTISTGAELTGTEERPEFS